MEKIKENFNLWIPSPLQRITNINDCKIFVKRDDLIHSVISGNKYRKLKHILLDFELSKKQRLIAFGGAFSNLLHALSLVSKQMGIKATFYIRGDGFDESNYTLKFIKNNGVDIIFMSRHDFKQIREKTYLEQLSVSNPDAYIIPEGASNKLATYGSSEIYDEIIMQLGYVPDYIVMDIGTGGTFAGVLQKITEKTKLIGIPVVKGVKWNFTLSSVIGQHVKDVNYQIMEDYHFGGFGKFNSALIEFINFYKFKFGIELDPMYTGKLVFGLHDLMSKEFFRKGSTVVWIHGGGNQGIKGFNQINKNVLL